MIHGWSPPFLFGIRYKKAPMAECQGGLRWVHLFDWLQINVLIIAYDNGYFIIRIPTTNLLQVRSLMPKMITIFGGLPQDRPLTSVATTS